MADLAQTDRFSRLPDRYQDRARQIACRVGDIDNLCRPATTTVIGDTLKRLRRHFRPQPDTEPRDMAEGFREACRDLPEWALSEAANDFLGGKVENHTGQYMPTCAEFAKHARSILLPFLAERAALRTEAEKLVERAADDHRRHMIEMERQDPAVRARIAELVERATAGAPKPVAMKHKGLSADVQDRIDKLKKSREFQSKLDQTRIVRSGSAE